MPHSKETSNLITRFVKLLNARKLGENTDKIIKAFRQVDKDFFGELASIRGVKSDVLKSSNGDFWTRLGNKNCWVNPNNQYWENNSFLSNFSPNIYVQGSFALGTAIKPIMDDEYDVDVVCLLQLTKTKVSQDVLLHFYFLLQGTSLNGLDTA